MHPLAAVALFMVAVEVVLSRQFAWCSAPTLRRSAAAAATSAAIAAAMGAPDAALAKRKKKEKENQFTLSYLPAPNISGVEYPDYDNPPKPDENPYIRELQRKSWERQPEIRVKDWLQAELRQSNVTNIFTFTNQKYPVRYASDSTRFDILGKSSFSEASNLGKILEDPALDFPNDEFKCWMYATAKDEEWSSKNLDIMLTLQMPDALVKKIARIRSLKFGG